MRTQTEGMKILTFPLYNHTFYTYAWNIASEAKSVTISVGYGGMPYVRVQF